MAGRGVVRRAGGGSRLLRSPGAAAAMARVSAARSAAAVAPRRGAAVVAAAEVSGGMEDDEEKEGGREGGVAEAPPALDAMGLMRLARTSVPGVFFRKYQADGVDYIVVDLRGSPEGGSGVFSGSQVRRLCSRGRGVGAEGFVFLLDPSGESSAADGPPAACALRTFRADGDEVPWCGAGLRCAVAALEDALAESGVSESPTTEEAASAREGAEEGREWIIDMEEGRVTPTVHADGAISVDYGKPTFSPAEVPTTLSPNEYYGPDAAAVEADVYSTDPEESEAAAAKFNAVMAHPLCLGGHNPFENRFSRYYSPQQRAALNRAEGMEESGDFWVVSCVNVGGTPYVVTPGPGLEYVTDSLDVDRMDLPKWGEVLEHHEAFPEKASVAFVQLWEHEEAMLTGRYGARSEFNRQLEAFQAGRTSKPPEANLRMRAWERNRGESACSAGAAAAAAVVSYMNNVIPVPETTVSQPGGMLEVFWASDEHVYVTGFADCVFEGTLYPPVELLDEDSTKELLEAEVSRTAAQDRKRGGQAAGAREAEAEIFRRIDRHVKKQTTL